MSDARTNAGEDPGRGWTPGRLARVWGPPVVYLGLIFWLSALARPLGAVKVGDFDKLAHFVEYALLGALLARGFAGSLRRPGFGRVLVLGAAAALLYGVTDEVHQAFVPGRDPDVWDLVADGLGALLGATLWALRVRPEPGRPPDAGDEASPSAG